MNKITKIGLTVITIFISTLVVIAIKEMKMMGIINIFVIMIMLPLIKYIWNKPSPKDLQPPFPAPQLPKRGSGKEFDGNLYGKAN